MQKNNICSLFLLYFVLIFSHFFLARQAYGASSIRPIHDWDSVLRFADQNTLVISDIQGTLLTKEGLAIRPPAWDVLKASSIGVVGFTTNSSSSGIVFSEIDYKLSEAEQKITKLDGGCFCSSEKVMVVSRFVTEQVTKNPSIKSLVVVDDSMIILRCLERKLDSLKIPLHILQFIDTPLPLGQKPSIQSLFSHPIRKDFIANILPTLKTYGMTSLAQLVIGEYLGEEEMLKQDTLDLPPPGFLRNSLLVIPRGMIPSPTVSPRDDTASARSLTPTTSTPHSIVFPHTPSSQPQEKALGIVLDKYAPPPVSTVFAQPPAILTPPVPQKKSFWSCLSCCLPQNTAKVFPE